MKVLQANLVLRLQQAEDCDAFERFYMSDQGWKQLHTDENDVRIWLDDLYRSEQNMSDPEYSHSAGGQALLSGPGQDRCYELEVGSLYKLDRSISRLRF